jgi:urease accessory protein
MAQTSNLHLAFEAGSSGSTILRIIEQQPPWRVVRGFRAPSGETLAHVHNLSGGILDSDALACQIDLAPGAQAQVTSTGATRIYRSRSADRRASQRLNVRIASEAYLEYLPDQLIPYAGSRFTQTARIEIEPGGSLIWWDRVAPGREASGETFGFESLALDFKLTAAGEPVALERWTLTPQTQRMDSVARLGPFRHFASCYVCRAGEPAAYWRRFESQLQSAADRFSSAEVLWGVTSLRAHGVAIRGVSSSGRSLAEGLVEIWKAAKWILCGRVATLPRKVH